MRAFSLQKKVKWANNTYVSKPEDVGFKMVKKKMKSNKAIQKICLLSCKSNMVQHKQTGLIMRHSGLRHNPNMKQFANITQPQQPFSGLINSTVLFRTNNKTALSGPPKERQKERNILTHANTKASFFFFFFFFFFFDEVEPFWIYVQFFK